MTGTIELITILLLMVIQHGGDDVSCKRSIIAASNVTEIIRTKPKFAGCVIINAVFPRSEKLCFVLRFSLIYIFFKQLAQYAMFGSFLV